MTTIPIPRKAIPIPHKAIHSASRCQLALPHFGDTSALYVSVLSCSHLNWISSSSHEHSRTYGTEHTHAPVYGRLFSTAGCVALRRCPFEYICELAM